MKFIDLTREVWYSGSRIRGEIPERSRKSVQKVEKCPETGHLSINGTIPDFGQSKNETVAIFDQNGKNYSFSGSSGVSPDVNSSG